MVRKGQEIAWLDPTNYAIGKELADIQVDQVTDEFNRINILHERNSVSESDFMKCKYALEGAKAQQKLRAKDLADTKLYAPINGMLLKKMGEAGEMISAGMPVLVISDISKVKVNAYIPENQLKYVKIGQEVNITFDDLRLGQYGINPQDIVTIMRSQNGIFPTGSIKTGESEVSFHTNGYYDSVDELEKPDCRSFKDRSEYQAKGCG